MSILSRWAVLITAALFALLRVSSAQEPPAVPRDVPSPPPAVGESAPLRELTVEPATPAVEAQSTPAVANPTPNQGKAGNTPTRAKRKGRGNAVVVYNGDAFLAKGLFSEAVVSIGGSSTALGDVNGAVVSILGDSRAEGDVGDAVVSIIGNTYVNGNVDTVVAVLGGVELGPDAVVQDVVSIGGPIKRHPGSRMTGEGVELGFFAHLPDFTGFRAWIRNGFLLFRPLATGRNLGWTWAVAGTFLGIYVVIALMFGRGVDRCIETLESRPGRSLMVAIISLILAPVITILLAITVIGPVISVAVFVFATLFGKAAILGWLGRRAFFGFGAVNLRVQAPLAVLVGGVFLCALYLIPYLGMVIWTVASTMSLGVVVYTLLLGFKRRPALADPVPETPRMPPESYARVPTPSAVDLIDVSRGTTVEGTGSLASVAGGTATLVEPPHTPEPAGFTPPVSIPVLPAAAMPRAGFWLRAAALGIDVILVGVISLFVSAGSTFLLLLAAYGAVMWKVKGTTIGGIVCGLKVVRLDDRPVDWTSSIVRALACFLSLFVVGLGFIWVVFDDEKQSWHDKIAGTIVVRVPPGTSLV